MIWSPGVFCVGLKNLKRFAFASLFFAFSADASHAGFLEDLFGDPDPSPHAAAPGYAPRGRDGAWQRGRSSRRDAGVRSELRFMPSAAARGKGGQDRRDMTGSSVVKDSKSSAGSKPIVAALCAPESTIAGASAVGLLAYDKTLRDGDIMITDTGVKVFRGHAACPHDSRNFVALSSMNMPKARRSVLLAIEDSMKRPPGYLLAAKYEKTKDEGR